MGAAESNYLLRLSVPWALVAPQDRLAGLDACAPLGPLG